MNNETRLDRWLQELGETSPITWRRWNEVSSNDSERKQEASAWEPTEADLAWASELIDGFQTHAIWTIPSQKMVYRVDKDKKVLTWMNHDFDHVDMEVVRKMNQHERIQVVFGNIGYLTTEKAHDDTYTEAEASELRNLMLLVGCEGWNLPPSITLIVDGSSRHGNLKDRVKP